MVKWSRFYLLTLCKASGKVRVIEKRIVLLSAFAVLGSVAAYAATVIVIR